MRKAILLVVGLSGLCLAQPKVAMVLKVEGTARNKILPVVTGQMWEPGEHIELAAGSKLTVLLLNKGERLEISGQGGLDVSTQGLTYTGSSRSKALVSNQVKMSLNGENYRQIGGMNVRGGALPPVFNSVLDRVEVGVDGVTVSQTAGAGQPPRLKFYYSDKFTMPVLGIDLKTVEVPVTGPPATSAFATEVPGEKVGSRWQWRVAWPLEDTTRSYALQVLPVASDTVKLYTRVYRPTAGELEEVAEARLQVAAWAKKEPGTTGPWVYLATLLEEKGQLESALVALKSALVLQPRDAGLRQMRARLLLDLGRYRQAAQALRP